MFKLPAQINRRGRFTHAGINELTRWASGSEESAQLRYLRPEASAAHGRKRFGGSETLPNV